MLDSSFSSTLAIRVAIDHKKYRKVFIYKGLSKFSEVIHWVKPDYFGT